MTGRAPDLIVSWSHDGVTHLEFYVDGPELSVGDRERIRRSTALASSHGGMRMMVETAVGERYLVSVRSLGEITTVRLVPHEMVRQGRGVQP